MRTCIVCRVRKNDFNDEHVIPDSMGGHYHIYSVCISCNSRLGQYVDPTLASHKLVEMKRAILGIKNKNGDVINPFRGLDFHLKHEPSQQMMWGKDETGQFILKMKPNMPSKKAIQDGTFVIKIDARDEAGMEGVFKKIFERTGVDIPALPISVTKETLPSEMRAPMQIDIRNFRMGLLKIAYEFTVDQLPSYFDDSFARRFSEILKFADFDALKSKSKVTFLGNGFSKDLFAHLDHLVDVTNDNHYIILINQPPFGLYCFIKIFNVIFQAIKMSERNDYFEGVAIIGINSISMHTFEVLKGAEITNRIYSDPLARFLYDFDTAEEMEALRIEEEQDSFDYHTENSFIPLFNSAGEIQYASYHEKVLQPQLKQNKIGDGIDTIVTEYFLNEDLYIKHAGSEKLHRVLAVRLERKRIGKL